MKKIIIFFLEIIVMAALFVGIAWAATGCFNDRVGISGTAPISSKVDGAHKMTFGGHVRGGTAGLLIGTPEQKARAKKIEAEAELMKSCANNSAQAMCGKVAEKVEEEKSRCKYKVCFYNESESESLRLLIPVSDNPDVTLAKGSGGGATACLPEARFGFTIIYDENDESRIGEASLRHISGKTLYSGLPYCTDETVQEIFAVQ
ncbi:MAG: hypothetical protein ABH881_03500 [bacterium]